MTSRIRKCCRQIVDDSISDARLWSLVFLAAAGAFLIAAHWTLNNSDSVAAAWPAWSLVHQGTLHLEHVAQLPLDPWFVRGAHSHLVSSRTPGVVLIGVPFQALFAWSGLGAMAPSVAAASIITAAAVSNLTLLLRRLSSAEAAVAAALVLALGTPLWTVAGAELWTHGPDALWLSAALLAFAHRRVWWSGAFFSLAVLTRPHLVLVVAVFGVWTAWSRRNPQVLAAMALPSALALATVICYNDYLFRSNSLSGGTYGYAAHNALHGRGPTTTSSNLKMLTESAGILFSPMRGLVPYAPVLLLGVLAVRTSWRQLPDWGRAASVGGLIYLLAQARINGIYSSFGFYGSRLGIESMVLWTPLVFLAARTLWQRSKTAVYWVSALSIGVELAGAAFGRVMTVPLTADPWRTWLPLEVVRSGGAKATLLMVLYALLTVLLAVRLSTAMARPAATPSAKALASETVAPAEAPVFNVASRTACDVVGST